MRVFLGYMTKIIFWPLFAQYTYSNIYRFKCHTINNGLPLIIHKKHKDKTQSETCVSIAILKKKRIYIEIFVGKYTGKWGTHWKVRNFVSPKKLEP